MMEVKQAKKTINDLFARLEGEDWKRAKLAYLRGMNELAVDLTDRFGEHPDLDPDPEVQVKHWMGEAQRMGKLVREWSRRAEKAEAEVERLRQRGDVWKALSEKAEAEGKQTEEQLAEAQARLAEAMEANDKTEFRFTGDTELAPGDPKAEDGEANEKMSFVRKANDRLDEAIEEDDPEKADRWLYVIGRLKKGI